MKDYKLNINSLGSFIGELTKMIMSDKDKSWRVTIKGWREKRSLSQNAFQHVIYDDISKYLISKGRKDWCPKFTKKNMKNNFLGWEKTEYTDVKTGEITIREELISTSNLDVGVACDYITKLLDFAQSIGCNIKIPAVCDYRDYLNQQDE